MLHGLFFYVPNYIFTKEMVIAMSFGTMLRFHRKQLGMTQVEVAERIGVSRRTYVAYENDKRRPKNPKVYSDLAILLNCDRINVFSVQEGPDEPKNRLTLAEFDKLTAVAKKLEKTPTDVIRDALHLYYIMTGVKGC